MDKSLEDFIASLPNDNRRIIVRKLAQRAMESDAAEVAKQQALAAKAVPAATWLGSLKRVAKPEPDKK